MYLKEVSLKIDNLEWAAEYAAKTAARAANYFENGVRRVLVCANQAEKYTKLAEKSK